MEVWRKIDVYTLYNLVYLVNTNGWISNLMKYVKTFNQTLIVTYDFCI